MDAVSIGMASNQRQAPGVNTNVPNRIPQLAIRCAVSSAPVVHWLQSRNRLQHGWKGNAGGTQNRQTSKKLQHLQGSEGIVEVFASTR